MKKLSIYVPPDLLQELRRVCAERGVSMKAFVAETVAQKAGPTAGEMGSRFSAGRAPVSRGQAGPPKER